MNVNLYVTKDYRKKDDFAVRKNKPNSNPVSERPKMNTNLFTTKDYENKTDFRLPKNKPKQSQGIIKFRSIFRRFILAFLTQAPHINASAPIISLKNKGLPPKIIKKLKKLQFYPNFNNFSGEFCLCNSYMSYYLGKQLGENINGQ